MPVVPRLARHAALAVCCALVLAANALWPVAAQTGITPSTSTNTTETDARSCALLWQVTPVLGGSAGEPPSLRLSLRFNGGRRSQTNLHLPGGWAGLAELPTLPALTEGDAAGPRLQTLPGAPAWRRVDHAPGETVLLQWRLLPPSDATQGGSIQLTPSWFAFSGQGVLPMPEGADEPGAGPACVALQGLGANGRWASSHGSAQGPSALWVLGPSPVPLAQRVQQALYAGGALQLQAAPGVLAVLPAGTAWTFTPAALAQAGVRALAAQQRQWPQPTGREASSATPWMLLALPASSAAPQDKGLASAWHQALALQLPPAWTGSDPQLEALLTEALARAWTAERFGPLAHAGRGDAPLRAWFSDGWAEFLAHRSLLREGLWTADDYAATLNARIAAYLAEPARALPNNQLVLQMAANSAQSPSLATLQAMRGEWLALQWHQALRRSGQPGLDAVLRQQLVAPAQARREGPISQPLATHRLVAALRALLQEQPLRDLQQHIEQGQPFDFGPDSLGPCFQPVAAAERGAAPAYRPVAGALQQADCQGWLGLGPLADAAVPRGRTEASVRSNGKKTARKPGNKASANTSSAKAPAKASGKTIKKTAPTKSGKPAR